MKNLFKHFKIPFLLMVGLFLLCGRTTAQSQAAGPGQYASEPLYEAAYHSIRAMIDGEKPVSFKRAVFLSENAFLEGNLNYQVFNQQIENLAELSHLVRQSRPLVYDKADSLEVAKNAALFTVLADSIPILMGVDTVWLEPFTYDFKDFNGRLEWSQMFVSKLLESGKGNCHSLPFLYKILADETGAKAWLSLSPNHIYIKARSKKDGWYNTELTSGYFPHDAWLMASGYVHLNAIRNGLYMDTLSKREAIATVLMDLAQGYQKKFGVGDGRFILRACDKVLEVDSTFVNALLLRAETQRKLLFGRYGLRYDLAEISDSLRADPALESLRGQYEELHRLGYRRMPDAMYLDWLSSFFLVYQILIT
ncbi:MAG TPA: hypothetical protein ENJ82_07210 [Bacteroidetes bacterium]|nr:hypothetical protein [Bacteroidota bacterium]